MAKRRGFTTMTDIEEFKAMTWSYLKNITMQWEYDGMAYLFRTEGVPLYGIDLGTTKTNHAFLGMFIPEKFDKNFGVNIFVPSTKFNLAKKLLADEAEVKRCSFLEVANGAIYHERFYEDVAFIRSRKATGNKERRLRKCRQIKERYFPLVEKRPK